MAGIRPWRGSGVGILFVLLFLPDTAAIVADPANPGRSSSVKGSANPMGAAPRCAEGEPMDGVERERPPPQRVIPNFLTTSVRHLTNMLVGRYYSDLDSGDEDGCEIDPYSEEE